MHTEIEYADTLFYWDRNHIANTSSVQYWNITMIPACAQCTNLIQCYGI